MKLRRRWQGFARSLLDALGVEDIRAGGRTIGFHHLALQEAGLVPPARGTRVFPFMHRYPLSLIDRVRALPGEKIHDFGFLGSVFTSDVFEARRWVLDFAREHFTAKSLLVISDCPAGYRPLGPFDQSTSQGWERFRPKATEGSGRLHVDTGYFASLRQTRFTLCPGGDQPWSIRFFEAIMCGSLPIVESPRHAGRNALERAIGYRFYVLGDRYEYRADWVAENFQKLMRHQTFARLTLAARLRNRIDRAGLG